MEMLYISIEEKGLHENVIYYPKKSIRLEHDCGETAKNRDMYDSER